MTPPAPPESEIWFLTGSQSLYGEETLAQVTAQSREICRTLAERTALPARLVWKPVLADAAAIRRICLDAEADDTCAGLIAWMHTFSPAKMWISGLDALRKPLLHLHTQANQALPWATIDMDFMNLNQAAHGDREFGHVQTRLGVARKTVAGHVADPAVGRPRRVLGAGGGRAGGAGDAAAGPVRRQHAGRRGDRGRQGRGPAPVRGLRQRVRGERPGRRRRRDRRGHRGRAGGGVRRPVRRRRRAAPGRAPPRLPPLRGPDRGGPARLPHRGRLPRLHHQLRGPGRVAAAAGPGRAAADGRRLRLRRRGRLEDLGAAARPEGDGATDCPAAPPSWRTTRTTSRPARR